MTHTDPTAAALLRAILLRPADDTARLVYADWLDEHGEHERAEFVRVQVFGRGLLGTAQACPHCVDGARLGDVGTGAPPRCTECCGTGSRYGREWSGIPCPVCEGKGWIVGPPGGRACRLCGDNTTNNGTGFAPVEFRRGFVESVRCRMEDVLIRVCGRCKGTGNDPAEPMHPCLRCLGSRKPAGQYESAWTLTPWARGVLAAHPVTAWEITDLPANIAVLPQPAYRAACAIDPNPGTREREVEVIALAVARVARRLAGLPEVTP